SYSPSPSRLPARIEWPGRPFRSAGTQLGRPAGVHKVRSPAPVLRFCTPSGEGPETKKAPNQLILLIWGFFVAEREGFEPSVPKGHTCFRDRPDRPLRHLSIKKDPASQDP